MESHSRVTHTAQINNLEAKKASIVQLEAVFATIGTVEAEVAKIQTLVNGNLTSENIHSLHLTSASVTVENGFIKNAMIENLDVSKVNAGDISTNKFRIKSDDGGIEIVGATQQFKDKNNKVRVQIGRDKNNNFTFSLFDETGVGVLIDHTGIKKGSIANDLIISDMIASDSVGEKQINYTSFVTGFNKDTNTNTIKSTKIMLNNQNQTLDIAFNSIKTQVDTTKALTESHSTTIGIMQGQISTAINNTQIVKDGQTILLKDDYNRTVQTIDSMKLTIGSHTSQISGLNSTVSIQGSSIEQLKNQISLKVEQTDINKAIDNLEIGGRNLFSGFDEKEISLKDYQNRGSFTQFVNNLTFNPADYLEEEFTISFYAKSPNGTTSLQVYNRNNNPRYFYFRTTLDNALGGKWKYCTYTFTNKDRGESCNISNKIEIYAPNQMGVLVKQIKVEKGNKVTDWTPAPEDVDSSISAIDSKITTTNNKVSSIETNLSSITSRVSNVENTTATINGNVTNLQTRMNTAEQKITATAITSTITEQINNDHILVNTSSTKLDKYVFHFIKNNQKLSSLKNGGLYSYNSNNGKFLGSMQPILPTSNTYSSFGFLASGNCDMFQIAYAPSWVNDTENIAGAGLTSVFNINFVDKSSAGITKGAYLYTNLNLTGYLAMNGNNIIGANAIGASEFQCNKFYSTNGGKPILMEYLGSELKIYPTVITGKMYPSYNNGLDLGQSTHRYRTVYSVNSLNTSDRSYKENIEYLNSNIGISKLNEDITLLDMHEFIKNDLHLAKYNYIDQKHKEFGFIADDIVCTKVGSKLIIGKKGEYSYSVGSYISVIVGALKTEINIRDNQIKILEERISKLENLVKI